MWPFDNGNIGTDVPVWMLSGHGWKQSGNRSSVVWSGWKKALFAIFICTFCIHVFIVVYILFSCSFPDPTNAMSALKMILGEK